MGYQGTYIVLIYLSFIYHRVCWMFCPYRCQCVKSPFLINQESCYRLCCGPTMQKSSLHVQEISSRLGMLTSSDLVRAQLAKTKMPILYTTKRSRWLPRVPSMLSRKSKSLSLFANGIVQPHSRCPIPYPRVAIQGCVSGKSPTSTHAHDLTQQVILQLLRGHDELSWRLIKTQVHSSQWRTSG